MLHAAGLPERFWSLACQAAVYINNRLPSKATNNITPRQLWCGKPPHIGHIRTFGCLAYALVHNPTKLADRAARCTFVGYPTDASRTYLLWDNHQHKLLRSGHVHFVESINGWNYNPKLTVVAGEATAAAGRQQQGRHRSTERALRMLLPFPICQQYRTPITTSQKQTSNQSTWLTTITILISLSRSLGLSLSPRPGSSLRSRLESRLSLTMSVSLHQLTSTERN